MAKTKDKQPWFKFYPQDWRGDAKLRMCSIAARGLWAEMLCVMHEAEPYGHLLSGGKMVVNRQLAALAGISLSECGKLLCELESAGVYSRTEDKVIYSRRMVRDRAKADRDRENGKEGGSPDLLGGIPKSDRAGRFSRKDNPTKVEAVWSASGGRCAMCACEMQRDRPNDLDAFTVDHIIALAHGGSNDLANLQALCRSCNRRKGITPLGAETSNGDKAQKPLPEAISKTAAAAVILDEGQEKQVTALKALFVGMRAGKGWAVPNLEHVRVWLAEGIASGTISTACTPILKRKEDMVSIVYCDSAVRDAHAAAPILQEVVSNKVWVDEGTPEFNAHVSEAFRKTGRGIPVIDQRDTNGELTGRRGWYVTSLWPEGFNDFGERIPPKTEDAA